MAKVKSNYMRAAQSMGRYKGSLYDVMATEYITDRKKQDIIDRANREQKTIETLSEGIGTMERLNEEKATQTQIQEGRKVLEDSSGIALEGTHDNRPKIMDFIRGDAKLEDIPGRMKTRFKQGFSEPTYSYGNTKYTEADLLAIGHKNLENKYVPLLGGDSSMTVDKIWTKVLEVESGNDPMAISYQYNTETGLEDKTKPIAYGAPQLKPETAMQPGFGAQNVFEVADSLDVKYGDKNKEEAIKLLQHKEVGNKMGLQYMKSLYKELGGDLEKTLVAYNWGIGNAKSWGGSFGKLPGETQGYLQKILYDSIGQKLDATTN